MQGEPRSCSARRCYGDVGRARSPTFLRERVAALRGARRRSRAHRARPRHRLRQDAWRRISSCCARQRELLALGYPLLVGWSRKSTLGAVDRPRRSASACAPASRRRWRRSQRGARIVRVHDVARHGRRADGLARCRPAGARIARTAQEHGRHEHDSYFGTDGIRGTVGQAPITPDFVLRLGHAVGRVLQAQPSARPTVLIGKDTRISGYMIESALEAGFASAGVDVLLTGPAADAGRRLPHARAARSSLGVVISASHNPYRRQRHQVLLRARREAARRLGAGGRGGARRAAALGRLRASSARRGASTTRRGRYIEFCKSTFANDLTLQGPEDRRRRRARRGLPRRARRVPRTRRRGRSAIGCAPDGLNINDGVGATAPAGAGRGRAGAAAPTTASRSTATPTACRWSTPTAASTTATSCCT